MATALPIDYLRECMSYDAESGDLTWLTRPLAHFPSSHACNAWNARYAGRTAGRVNAQGYVEVGVDGFKRNAARIAFALAHGRYPEPEVDHVNRVRSDNRLTNLREATRAMNLSNRSRVGRLPRKTSAVVA